MTWRKLTGLDRRDRPKIDLVGNRSWDKAIIAESDGCKKKRRQRFLAILLLQKSRLLRIVLLIATGLMIPCVILTDLDVTFTPSRNVPSVNEMFRVLTLDAVGADFVYLGSNGLGHRQRLTTCAVHRALMTNSTIYIKWRECNGEPVFENLVEITGGGETRRGPVTSPVDNMPVGNASVDNGQITFSNGVDDYSSRNRFAPSKVRSDYIFYSFLRDNFRGRNELDAFVKENFEDFTVIGVHIRAGNNETTANNHFTRMGRQIDDMESWTANLTQLLRSYVDARTFPPDRPPAIFLASDTPSASDAFRRAVAMVFPRMSVVALDQPDLREGSGIKAAPVPGGSSRACIRHARGVLADQIALAKADVLFAARRSSFTQTLPASLIMHEKKWFCEVTRDANDMACFTNYTHWVTRGHVLSFVKREPVQSNMYAVAMPPEVKVGTG